MSRDLLLLGEGTAVAVRVVEVHNAPLEPVLWVNYSLIQFWAAVVLSIARVIWRVAVRRVDFNRASTRALRWLVFKKFLGDV